MSRHCLPEVAGAAVRLGGELLIVQTAVCWFGADSWHELRSLEKDIFVALYCDRQPSFRLTRILPYDLPPGVAAESRQRFDDWLAVSTLMTTGAPTGAGRVLLATRPLERVPEVTSGRIAIDALLRDLGDSLIDPEPPLFE